MILFISVGLAVFFGVVIGWVLCSLCSISDVQNRSREQQAWEDDWLE
jgi:hypothetical protein